MFVMTLTGRAFLRIINDEVPDYIGIEKVQCLGCVGFMLPIFSSGLTPLFRIRSEWGLT